MAQMILASSIVMITFLIVMAIIYYIFSRKGMKAQKKHFEELHQNLKAGQKVQLSSGIYGVLKKINKETVEMEMKSGGIVEVSRYAISEIIK